MPACRSQSSSKASATAGCAAPTISAKELIVATKEAPPFVIKRVDGTLHGISIDLWRRIAERLHLRYRFSEQATVQALLAGTAAGANAQFSIGIGNPYGGGVYVGSGYGYGYPGLGLGTGYGYPGYGLVRTRASLDEQLARRAQAAGAKLVEGANVTGPVLDDDGRVIGVTVEAEGAEKQESTASDVERSVAPPQTFRARVAKTAAEDFVARLRAEQKARHSRFGDTIFLLEPDLKNGPGGMRDLCVGRWAAMARFGTLASDNENAMLSRTVMCG